MSPYQAENDFYMEQIEKLKKKNEALRGKTLEEAHRELRIEQMREKVRQYSVLGRHDTELQTAQGN